MKIENVLTFRFETAETASIFYSSFAPEIEDSVLKRSSWEVAPPDPASSVVIFTIYADDATAFRATVNSVIQIAHIVEKTVHIVEHFGEKSA